MIKSSDLYVQLSEFKNGTLDLIKSVEDEDYDSLEKKFNERQEIINKIEKLTYQKDEFIRICQELQIPDLNQKLDCLMHDRKNKIKNEMTNLVKKKNANNSYTKKMSVDPLFFNKKI